MKRALILSTILVAGCGASATSDAPTKSTDMSGADIVNMPDEFPNIAFKCLGANGIYVNTRTGGVNMIVVENDTNCPATKISG